MLTVPASSARHLMELGWMESRDYVTVSQETAETQVRAPLLRHGIRVP